METTNLGKSIREIFDGQHKYIVPLYQRNFAWRQEQIEQLLQDIYEAYNDPATGNYFIGSLVVLKRTNGDFEVIDGQQRLTTLSLITKIMGITETPHLFYDSRPEVEEFFHAFYKSKDGECSIDYPQTFHLRNAIEYIYEAKLDAENDGITITTDDEKFKTYFANNVILVRVEIPQDTDVASYFEIMNNRGEQLQKHEILKSLMMSKMKDPNHRSEFALIWDACSQMDVPIQKSFKAGTRSHYFGDSYDDFCFYTLSSDSEYSQNDNKDFSIDEIIDGGKTIGKSGEMFAEDEEYESESQYKSIIDFPNFLMHVFKVMFPNKNIPLNEKFLLSIYKELENDIDSDIFIRELLYCRTIFDRYVVKTTLDEKDTDDGEKWELIKPKRYDKKWEYIGTYNDNKGTSRKQYRIVKALSMLQVTFRTRTYKNWLYEVLKWFNEKSSIDVSYEDYIVKLDTIILDNYKERDYKKLEPNESLTKENSFSLGTKTPHFLFNFIDYLYWVDSQKDDSIFKKDFKGFEFKYWNSVEHHLAKQYAEDTDKDNFKNYIDNLGNLCLISKNANSRLNDRSVQEKVERSKDSNKGPNRQIIYKETEFNNFIWDQNKIKEHYNELLCLLQNCHNILGIKESNSTL